MKAEVPVGSFREGSLSAAVDACMSRVQPGDTWGQGGDELEKQQKMKHNDLQVPMLLISLGEANSGPRRRASSV